MTGNYEGITWQNVAAREGTKNGVLPMGIDDFMKKKTPTISSQMAHWQS